jgi:hypothetical protein
VWLSSILRHLEAERGFATGLGGECANGRIAVDAIEDPEMKRARESGRFTFCNGTPRYCGVFY